MSREALTRLAIAQAVYKAMGDQLATNGGKHGNNIRTEADDMLRASFDTLGTDRIALEVNGERVGTLSARITKPTNEIGYSLTNPGELVEWLRSGEGYAVLTEVVKKQWKAIAKASVDMDGEVPPGIDASTYSVPARWDGTTLRVDVAKVRDALGTGLPAAVAGVISGEVE